MPRFRIMSGSDDPDEDYDVLHEKFDDAIAPTRRRRPRQQPVPRLVIEGKSGRTVIDADSIDPNDIDTDTIDPGGIDTGGSRQPRPGPAPFSSYDVATHGPDPVPDWLVTSLSAGRDCAPPRPGSRFECVRSGCR